MQELLSGARRFAPLNMPDVAAALLLHCRQYGHFDSVPRSFLPGAPHLDFEMWVRLRGGPGSPASLLTGVESANRVLHPVNPLRHSKTHATQTNKTTNLTPASCRLITPDLLHLNHQEKHQSSRQKPGAFPLQSILCNHQPLFFNTFHTIAKVACPIFCAVGRVSVAQLFLSSSSRRWGCGEVGSA